MAEHLVLAGGGHAHLTTLLRIGEFVSRGHRVSVIGPKPYHYYSGMAPGMVSGYYRPQEIRFNTRRMVEDRGGIFIEDTVTDIEPGERKLTLASGRTIQYDIVSFNVGSKVTYQSMDRTDGKVFAVKPIEELYRARLAVEHLHQKLSPGDRISLGVIGGGPAGVELSGALWALARNLECGAEITLVTGGRLLGSFPDRTEALARKSLESRNIRILEGKPVTAINDNGITLEGGKNISLDMTFLATGVKPTPIFVHSLVPTGEDGGLLVNIYLQSVSYPEIFGGGDCITFRGRPLARVGVYAVRQNPTLFHNLLAALEGKPLKPFDPGSPSFLVILNMGDGTAILKKGGWIWQGRLAFRIKDYIDRRFMRKYQVSGELEEDLGESNSKPGSD